MKIKSIRWKKWLTVAVVLGMIAVGPGRFLLNRYDRELKVYFADQIRWSKFYFGSGLEHDLAVGNFKAGSSVESLMAKYPDLECRNFERWADISNKEGYSTTGRTDDGKHVIVYPAKGPFQTCLTAKDGKLVVASTRAITQYGEPSQIIDVFFDVRTADDRAASIRARQRFFNPSGVQERDRFTLQAAWAGVISTIRFDGEKCGYPNFDNPPRD
jgi:hypothetical protein